MTEEKAIQYIKKIQLQLILFFALVVSFAIAILITSFKNCNTDYLAVKTIDDNVYYMNYNIQTLGNSKKDKNIKYGHQLFINTPKYIGPDNTQNSDHFSGNRLSCNNCHLQGGTKPFAAPLIGIVKRFPQFRGRENKVGTIEERINGCMERSMNGKVLPKESKEMKAIVSYLAWLSRYAPKNGKIEGQGFVEIELPNRAINLNHGEKIFKTHCLSCHGDQGQGLKNDTSFTYLYPPLWGEDSYNNGAGMTRVITAAKFIKANMPFGTTYNSPVLTDEEAYDVSGYINQQLRPIKPNKEQDFPDLTKKPVSTPYPPYLDHFSVEQHQKGPFKPIIEYYKKKYNILKSK